MAEELADVQQSLVEDMDREQLRGFLRRLDPDEGADVLEFSMFLGLAHSVL